MGDLNFRPRGRYFEEIEVGQGLVTAGRTITESDIVFFAGLSGDYNQMHVDAVYAAGGEFGQRVAHGLLIVSIAVGLIVQTGFIEGTVMAFRELDWKFSLPVMIGETIRARVEVLETKALPRLGGGSIIAKVSVLNQDDRVVQRGDMVFLVRSKPD